MTEMCIRMQEGIRLLEQLNGLLDSGRFLLGGLAVRHYLKFRTSYDDIEACCRRVPGSA